MNTAFQQESFVSIWPEMSVLGASHFREVDGGTDDARRPFRADEATLERLNRIGAFQIFSARVGSKLVGYCSWNLSYDLESQGLLIATQGAWYVTPGHGRAGLRLFEFSLDALRSMGVKLVFPHHRLAGRSTWRLGKWFERLGAVPEQMTYRLWLEDVKHA